MEWITAIIGLLVGGGFIYLAFGRKSDLGDKIQRYEEHIDDYRTKQQEAEQKLYEKQRGIENERKKIDTSTVGGIIKFINQRLRDRRNSRKPGNGRNNSDRNDGRGSKGNS
jgi:hypothetical protein